MTTRKAVEFTGQFANGQGSHSRFCYNMGLENLSFWKYGKILRHEFRFKGLCWNVFVNRLEPRKRDWRSKLSFKLLSGNSVPVHAQVRIEAGNKALTEWKPCTACPFGWMYEFEMPSVQIKSCHQGSSSDDCSFAISMRYIREATEADKNETGYNMNTISLEEIDRNSIERRSGEEDPSGVAPATPHSDSCVHPDTIISYWTAKFPRYRYWECFRDNGILRLGKCLNDYDQFKTFGDVWKDFDKGLPVISVFKETRERTEEFEPTAGARLYFIKLFECGYEKDPSYCGHVLVPETRLFQDMLDEIVCKKCNLDDEADWEARQEVRELPEGKPITDGQGTLKQHGYLKHGSIINIFSPRLVREA